LLFLKVIRPAEWRVIVAAPVSALDDLRDTSLYFIFLWLHFRIQNHILKKTHPLSEAIMEDQRSGRMVVVAHCILNVHSLEDNLAIYPGLEQEVVELLVKKGIGIYQIPCPELELSGIFRKALPKESYDHPKIRDFYRTLADNMAKTLNMYVKKGYEIVAVIGAQGSPTCGIGYVGRWKDGIEGKREFPRDIEFVPGRGVFMEEFETALEKIDVHPEWVGIPGKSLRNLRPESFEETLHILDELLSPE
jgi:predicted secreted protein